MTTPILKNNLSDAVKILRYLDSRSTENGISRHFLEIELRDELCINGNVEGLVHMATKILEIALVGIEGTHHHFDVLGILDKCDIPLVVTYKSAEWDKSQAT